MFRQTFFAVILLLLASAAILTACNLTASKPTITIVSPPSGSTFRDGDDVNVQSTATDAAGVTRVELSVDGALVRTDAAPTPQGQPSFTVIQTWKATQGTHTLIVRAYNASGAVSDPAGISISVEPMRVAAATPTTPATLVPPTISPLTPLPPTLAPGTCSDNALFVADVTIPDGTNFSASQTFNKTWRLRNTGTCTWGAGYQFAFVGGEAMTSNTVVSVPATAPGATADLTVPMTAPTTPGTHTGQWQLRNPSGVLFGQKVFVKIVVPGAPSGVVIHAFTADAQDLAGGGKRVTFVWQSTGGVSAQIVSGTALRNPPTWSVQTNGTLTVELQSTNYPNPKMRLSVYDGKGNEATKEVQIAWTCRYNYFFTPAPAVCPQSEATTTQAAEQRFENGGMIWLKEVHSGQTVETNIILVLYSDGTWAQYKDTWTEGQAVSDPSITPPAGLYQPVRGFGKVWRENTIVHERLGWATAPEQGFETSWQWRIAEAPPTIGYVHTLDGRVIELTGQGAAWKFVTP